jgi:hypothetical protein
VADFFFVLRTFAIAIALFLAMQIRVGNRSVEQHSVAWLHSSSVVDSIQNVAEGAVHVFHVAGHKISGVVTHLPKIKIEEPAEKNVDKKRVAKRVGGRIENHKAVMARVETHHVTNDGDGVEPAAGSTPDTDEHANSSYRSFFDVKTVRDADSN